MSWPVLAQKEKDVPDLYLELPQEQIQILNKKIFAIYDKESTIQIAKIYTNYILLSDMYLFHNEIILKLEQNVKSHKTSLKACKKTLSKRLKKLHSLTAKKIKRLSSF